MSRKPFPILGLGILLMLGLVVAGLAFGAVRGRVVNPATALPVTGAVVTVDGRPAEVVAGGFSFVAGPGRHTINVRAPGYESVSIEAVSVPIFGVTLGPIELRNATVLMTVTENYPGMFPVDVPAAVTVGRSRYRVERVAKLKGLPVGVTTVTARAEGYDPAQATIELLPGENSVVMTLTPTLSIVASRTANAVMKRDYGALWGVLHPDLQRQYRYPADYIKQQAKKDAQVVHAPFTRLVLEDSTTTESYRAPVIDVTYPDASVVSLTLYSSEFDSSAGAVVERATDARLFFTRLRGSWRVIGVEGGG